MEWFLGAVVLLAAPFVVARFVESNERACEPVLTCPECGFVICIQGGAAWIIDHVLRDHEDSPAAEVIRTAIVEGWLRDLLTVEGRA